MRGVRSCAGSLAVSRLSLRVPDPQLLRFVPRATGPRTRSWSRPCRTRASRPKPAPSASVCSALKTCAVPPPARGPGSTRCARPPARCGTDLRSRRWHVVASRGGRSMGTPATATRCCRRSTSASRSERRSQTTARSGWRRAKRCAQRPARRSESGTHACEADWLLRCAGECGRRNTVDMSPGPVQSNDVPQEASRHHRSEEVCAQAQRGEHDVPRPYAAGRPRVPQLHD